MMVIPDYDERSRDTDVLVAFVKKAGDKPDRRRHFFGALQKDIDCIDAAKLQPDPKTEGRPDKWLILACRMLRMMDREDVADGLEEEFYGMLEAWRKSKGESDG